MLRAAVLSSILLCLARPANARVGSQASMKASSMTSLAGTAKARSNLSARATAPFAKEMTYTDNQLCRSNYCTNPIFPGIDDLPRLEALQWQCATTTMVRDHMDFCKDAVPYNPALPSPMSKATAVNELVKAQEEAAMTMFIYHLSGMGYEAWDYQAPSESDNDCVRSVWKMVCFTYFPRAEAGCKEGEHSTYKRPCRSSCQNFIKQCAVECCDESVSCVFTHTKTDEYGKVQLLSTGYVDEEGPSAYCTGAARRSASSSFFLCCLIGVLAIVLQGCDTPIPQHEVGNWRTRTNYLNEYKYQPPGKNANAAVLNSCAQKDASPTLQCNGRGYCRAFSKTFVATKDDDTPLSFCQCERDWADPECGTKRKSQMTAFFWSLFLGFLGADYFYLGYPLWGLMKLFTLGGFGFWWLIDIVRTASGPVYATYFRTAQDLPHWCAVLIILAFFLLIGFALAIETYMRYRRDKRRHIGELMSMEEAQHWKETRADLGLLDGPRFTGNPNFAQNPGFAGYGAALPAPLPSAGTPYARFGSMRDGRQQHPGPFGPAGIPGHGTPTPPAH